MLQKLDPVLGEDAHWFSSPHVALGTWGGDGRKFLKGLANEQGGGGAMISWNFQEGISVPFAKNRSK